jgi:hypothetical protein
MHRSSLDPLAKTNFDADEGFAAKPVTADLARRQLHVSLGVMGLIVAAAVTVISTVGFERRESVVLRADVTVQQPQFVRPMTAINATDVSIQPGG